MTWTNCKVLGAAGRPRPWVTLASIALGVLLGLAGGGCGFVSSRKYAATESQNRSLAEQTRAQLAEIENLRVHSRRVEDQLAQAEEELALITDRRRSGLGSLPPELSSRLVDLSRRYPGLEFDPETGISKFDEDVLFDSGAAVLRENSRNLLNEFSEIFRTPTAEEFKVMVVGHTDDRQVAKKETRDQYPSNWHLSTARALAVLDYLRAAGVPDSRLGVAGFGAQQPVADNRTPDARQQNRRVEIFVLGPDTPVVGWTETLERRY